MKTHSRKAFTMIELIFVVVIIGILAAVAIPKLSGTVHQAHLVKAKTTLASVRAALSTERQKRILRGDITSNISALGENSNAFSYFDGNTSGTRVLQNSVSSCTDEACWEITNATTYKYHVSSTEVAIFILANNRLDCKSGSETQCDKISK